MPVNNTHPEYELMTANWIRARDVLGGEETIKVAGEKYLPKLEVQSETEYQAYKMRASFFNACARTLAGYVGMIFRKPPYLRLPETNSALGKAMAEFNNDADMLGTSLYGYAKQVISEVVSVGRCGTLVDWEQDAESRAYAALYRAEQILNWRVERVNGRNIATLLVLHEPEGGERQGTDLFDSVVGEQIRVLRLDRTNGTDGSNGQRCVVDIWRPKNDQKGNGGKTEWELAETRIPLRMGKPLPLIPFVFHGPENSRPTVPRVPLEDIMAMNLTHYRMDADYKHGLHYTALPTAWVSGFDKDAKLQIGSSVAWVAPTAGATAGFLEFMGQGLGSFERALDHAERLMAVLGSRLLEGQKKVAETAEAMQIRQSGEDCILGSMAASVSESITQVLRWAYWWNSTEEKPDDVTDQQALLDLNTDFSTHGMSAQEITAVVMAWQAGAMSQDTMFELFRRSEILPDGRGNEEEMGLIGKAKASGKVTSDQLSVTSKPENAQIAAVK
ncbi:MAG: DUF4055 domain-containing protein [Verrucomicrobiota bacterium]